MVTEDVPRAAEAPIASANETWLRLQQRWSQGWRRNVFPYVFLVGLVTPLAGAWQRASVPLAILGSALIVPFVILYAVALRRLPKPLDPHRTIWLTALLAAITVAEVSIAGPDALAMAAFIPIPALFAFGERAWPLVAAAAATPVLLPPLVPSWRSGPAWATAVSVLLTGLIVNGFSELVRANQALVAARAEVARLAADQERTRISRDLHDLLGHSLTAITVKAQLARRLTSRDPSASDRELGEIEQLARTTLRDVRLAVARARALTLPGELAAARELLNARGIAAELPRELPRLDPATEDLFAWCVREGVTNVVRHAHASRCGVRVTEEQIEITDDGRGGTPATGNGLRGLAERAAALGGYLEAGPVPPSGWRLCAVVEPHREGAPT